MRTWNPVTRQLCLKTNIVSQRNRHQFELTYSMPAQRKHGKIKRTQPGSTFSSMYKLVGLLFAPIASGIGIDNARLLHG